MPYQAPPAPRGWAGHWAVSYAAVVFAMMTMQVSSLGFSPLIPDMKAAWGMNYTQVGTFTGLYGLMAMLVSLPAGLVIKRFGERRVLATGLTIAAAGLVAVSLAGSYLEGLGGRSLWVFGYRMAFVSVMTGVALSAPTHWRGKAMGLLGACSALATVFGAPFATAIGHAHGWRTGMQAFAAIALLGVAVFFLCYRQGAGTGVADSAAGAHGSGTAGGAGILAALRRPVAWVIPMLGLTNAAGFAATFFVPSVVDTQFHLPREVAAEVISASYGVAIFVNPLTGWLSDRYNRWLVLAGMVAVMIPACLAMNSPDIRVFGAATVVLVSLGHACANQAYPAAADLLRGRDTGPVMGIVALGGGIFGYLGPQMLGALRESSGGFALGWTVLAATTTLILVVVLALKAWRDRAVSAI